MSQDLFDSKISSFISNLPVEAVYLFGSRASGSANKDSDYDIAVFVPDKRNIDLRDLTKKISQCFKYPEKLQLSIVDLKNSSPLFLYQIIKNGICLFKKNANIADLIEADILHRYYDDQYRLKTYYQYLKKQYAG